MIAFFTSFVVLALLPPSEGMSPLEFWMESREEVVRLARLDAELAKNGARAVEVFARLHSLNSQLDLLRAKCLAPGGQLAAAAWASASELIVAQQVGELRAWRSARALDADFETELREPTRSAPGVCGIAGDLVFAREPLSLVSFLHRARPRCAGAELNMSPFGELSWAYREANVRRL